MLGKRAVFLFLKLGVVMANIGCLARYSTQVSHGKLSYFKQRVPVHRIVVDGKGLPTNSLLDSIQIHVRGGNARSDNLAHKPLRNFMKELFSMVKSITGTCLPPLFAAVRSITSFYRSLPKDALIAQIGLVYCFCGGCYPVLFAAIQAAKVAGLKDMLSALNDLIDEATIATETAKKENQYETTSFQDALSKTTVVVMKAIDPVKINAACMSLYTAWLGISVVLEREFAKTINYALTLGSYVEPILDHLLAPPAYLIVSDEYHQWIPFGLGWISKAIAIRVAWRLQRVLTACTSSLIGGLMFSRALMRMMHKESRSQRRGVKKRANSVLLEEALGYVVAAAGIYVQLGDGSLDPSIKFPFTLLTWPFNIAEKW
eukprot:CAMPEP_0178900974 /NCGR_PEP_ID=MMETSP0786-20121207/3762_1 /TAXON_ID=186022 /ORGANISM="Thalassionema frauenfeldii, Strain CCMP 1798" /LENGTH=372 /DNA_ID=CAMNT_0020572019 /DNA_START=405 /DNA_END=1520 /DNA_ORIENTATION=+